MKMENKPASAGASLAPGFSRGTRPAHDLLSRLQPVFLCVLFFVSACSRATHPSAAPPPNSDNNRNEVRFVMWGDTQFNYPEVFEREVHETNLLRPDFVIQVGDLIQGYSNDAPSIREEWRRYKFQTEPLTVPFYPVPGNHDVYTAACHEVYGEVWGQNRYNYSFDEGPVHCISLDTYWPKESDNLGDWQKKWLIDDLAAYAAKNGGEGSEELSHRSIFIFMHAPLFRYAKTHPGRKTWDEIHEVLKRYPVRMVVAGHTHEYVWEQRDGITYLVINSSGNMGRLLERGGLFHEYLHVSVLDGSDVRVAVVKAGSILPIDTVNSKERDAIPRYGLDAQAMRLVVADRSQPIDADVTTRIENKLKEPRTYRLQWQVPRASKAVVGPVELWLDLAPGASQDLAFHVQAPNVLDDALLPKLVVTSSQVLRTGVVPRDWEARYRKAAEDKKTDPTVLTTSIPLDAPVEFRAEWPLFIPPMAHAKRAAGAIAIDGKFDEAIWQTAAPIEDFHTAEGPKPETKTSVRFLYDTDALYVAAWMEEPNPAGMRANAAPPIATTWDDDDFELYIDAGSTQRQFMRLFQNYKGTRFSSWPIYSKDETRFQSTYESAIDVGADHWALEMRIPYKECGTDTVPVPGDHWGVNIWRHRQQSHQPRAQWSVMPIFPYDGARFGELIFE